MEDRTEIARASRLPEYDVLKGLGIILMVAFHAGAPQCVQRVGNCFHMAVFFVLAGWFFDFNHAVDIPALAHYLKRRLLRLWWPAVACGGLFMLLHNLLLDWHLINDLSSFYSEVPADYQAQHWSVRHLGLQLLLLPVLVGDMTKLAGAFWFLKALLVASLLYALISYFFRASRTQCLIAHSVVAVVLYLIGRYIYIPYVGALVGGGSMMTAYGLIHLGVVMKSVGLDVTKLNRSRKLLLCAGSLVGLILLSRLGTVSLALNRFPNALYLYVSTVLGWWFLRVVSALISGKIKTVLAYIGRHTMPIILFHFLAFKLVSYMGVQSQGLSVWRIAEFAVTFKTGIWWVPYTLVGIVLPLGLNELMSRALRRKVLP